jgi:hypothetical protein
MSNIKPEFIRHYINYRNLGALRMRRSILFFLIFFGDILIVGPIIADPFHKSYIFAVVPLILLFHFYAFWVVASPFKRQVEAFLCIGIFGALAAYGFLAVAHKYIYNLMGVKSPWVIVVIVLFEVACWVLICLWHFRNLTQGYYYYLESHTPVKQVGNYAYLFVAWIGILIWQMSLGYSVGNLYLGIVATAYVGLSVSSGMFCLLVHKYILIRRHPDWYEWEHEPRSLTKHKRKKGSNMK